MAPRTQKEEAALLEWANTFPLDENLKSLEEAAEPVVLSKILEDFDPRYAVQNLDNKIPSKWLSKKKGLEAVYRSLLRYIRNECPELDPIALEDPIDIDLIAEHNDTPTTVQLLTLLLLAAVKGPKGSDIYVPQIVANLDSWGQQEVMKLIQKFEAEASSNKVISDDNLISATVSANFDLAFEEEHFRLKKDHEALKKHAADLVTRNDHLRKNYDNLVEEKSQVDHELESLRKSGDSDAFIEQLKSRITENESLIAEQEHQLEDARVTSERQRKELDKLRGVGERVQNLQDELAAAKVQIVSLSKKANTVDHYQQKLQLLTNTEDENATLRRRVDTLESNQNDYDKVHLENDKLVLSNGELTTRIASQEMEIVELTNAKRHLEVEANKLFSENESLTAKKVHDEEFIKDLQNQLSQSATYGPTSPGTPSSTRGVGLSLEEELTQSESPNYNLELSRLKAENQLLKSNTAGTTNALLRNELETCQKRIKELQQDLQTMTEKYAIGQRQLDAVIGEQLSNEKLVEIIERLRKVGNLHILTENFYRDEAVANIRRLHAEANEELKTTKRKLAELQAALTSRDREILKARTDLSVVGLGEVKALEKLKATTETIYSSLQNDYMTLEHKYNDLLTDFELQKDQLAGIHETLAHHAQQDEGTTEATGESVVEQAQKSKEQIQKQEELIQDLQGRLKRAEEQSPDAQKAANETLIKNLARENALISSAWYDFTSRLQSNHVVLQRRQDAPKSWLNKQRQLVNAMPRR